MRPFVHPAQPQESEGLKHLILTDVSLRGRSFQQLLVEDERTHFGHFMETLGRPIESPGPLFQPGCGGGCGSVKVFGWQRASRQADAKWNWGSETSALMVAVGQSTVQKLKGVCWL